MHFIILPLIFLFRLIISILKPIVNFLIHLLKTIGKGLIFILSLSDDFALAIVLLISFPFRYLKSVFDKNQKENTKKETL
jgi:hypothetical protein